MRSTFFLSVNSFYLIKFVYISVRNNMASVIETKIWTCAGDAWDGSEWWKVVDPSDVWVESLPYRAPQRQRHADYLRSPHMLFSRFKSLWSGGRLSICREENYAARSEETMASVSCRENELSAAKQTTPRNTQSASSASPLNVYNRTGGGLPSVRVIEIDSDSDEGYGESPRDASPLRPVKNEDPTQSFPPPVGMDAFPDMSAMSCSSYGSSFSANRGTKRSVGETLPNRGPTFGAEATQAQSSEGDDAVFKE